MAHNNPAGDTCCKASAASGQPECNPNVTMPAPTPPSALKERSLLDKEEAADPTCNSGCCSSSPASALLVDSVASSATPQPQETEHACAAPCCSTVPASAPVTIANVTHAKMDAEKDLTEQKVACGTGCCGDDASSTCSSSADTTKTATTSFCGDTQKCDGKIPSRTQRSFWLTPSFQRNASRQPPHLSAS